MRDVGPGTERSVKTYCPAAAWSKGINSSLPSCGVFRLSGFEDILTLSLYDFEGVVPRCIPDGSKQLEYF